MLLLISWCAADWPNLYSCVEYGAGGIGFCYVQAVHSVLSCAGCLGFIVCRLFRALSLQIVHSVLTHAVRPCMYIGVSHVQAVVHSHVQL